MPRTCFAAMWLLLLAATASAQSFTPLGDLPGGAFESRAVGVSADGSTVVGSSESGDGTEAFRWRAGEGMVGLGDFLLGDFHSYATGVSADGEIVVGTGEYFYGALGFRWTEASGLTSVGPFGGGDTSFAEAITGDGATIAGSSSGNAFRFSSLFGLDDLGTLAGYGSFALGVNDDGSVVVGADVREDFQLQAFRWTEGGGMVGLGYPGGNDESVATAMSADGSIVVGTGYDAFHILDGAQAFVWRLVGGMTPLGWPAGYQGSESTDVTSDGAIVAGYAGHASSGNHAMLWDSCQGWRDLKDLLVDEGLELGGWQLRSASNITRVSGSLVIAGSGVNPDGDSEAFLAELPDTGCAAPAVPALPVAALGGAAALLLVAALAATRAVGRR